MAEAFEKWQEQHACTECGSLPDREAYEQSLRWRVQRLEAVLKMTPEERAQYDEEQKVLRQLNDATMAHVRAYLAREITSPVIHQFGVVGDGTDGD